MKKLLILLSLSLFITSFSCRTRNRQEKPTVVRSTTESRDARIRDKMDRADESMRDLDNAE